MKKKQHSHEIIHHPTTKKLNTQEEKKDFKHIFFSKHQKKIQGKKTWPKQEKKRENNIYLQWNWGHRHTHIWQMKWE